MRFTLMLTVLCGLLASSGVTAPALLAQAEGDEFAVPGCLDQANNDRDACLARTHKMVEAGVEARDAAKMADAWRITCVLRDRESCEQAARLYTEGGVGLAPDPRIAANFHASACELHARESCDAALDWFSRPGANNRDIRRLVHLYSDACSVNDVSACEKGAFIVSNGFGNRFSGVTDVALARKMAETGCRSGRSANSCLLIEVLYGDATLDGANPYTALRYARDNCAAGNDHSCLRLAVAAHREKNWAEAERFYASACQLGSNTGCVYAGDMKAMQDHLARQQAAKAGFMQPLQQGDYAGATYAAIYVYKSKDYLAEAIRYIAGKGRMGSVPTEHLYVTALWFPDGDVHRAADSEMRKRGTGLEGTFGTGTNNAGQAAARWQSRYGGNASSYHASSSGSSFTPRPMPSAAEISAQTRKKYHFNNCVMSKIPNNPNC